MANFIKDMAPDAPHRAYSAALAKLQGAGSGVRIAHLDSGLAPHPTFGDADELPANIRMDLGRNVFDPLTQGTSRPSTDLSRSMAKGASLIEYPDHGVKTLSVILGATDELKGVAPGVEIIPYRTENGPLFRDKRGPVSRGKATRTLGDALRHAMTLDPVPQVASISMGNPGILGPLGALRQLFGGEIGIAKSTRQAIDEAYEQGVIICCAAGQVIDRVIYPAKFRRTIGVGGFDRQGGHYDHYPIDGYDLPEFVDIWAQAQRINRAAFVLDSTPPKPIYASDGGEGDPSGTSYATPQVAAAAALWVAHHKTALDTGAFATDRWKRVEAFRAALAGSAKQVTAKIAGGNTRKIATLEIEALLKMPLTEPADSDKRSEAVKAGFW